MAMFSTRQKDTDTRPVCAVTGIPCPETGDRTKPVFCPWWKELIAEVDRSSGNVGETKFYRGCFISHIDLYMLSMTAAADHACASANEARDSAANVATFNLIPSLLEGVGAIPALPPKEMKQIESREGENNAT